MRAGGPPSSGRPDAARHRRRRRQARVPRPGRARRRPDEQRLRGRDGRLPRPDGRAARGGHRRARPAGAERRPDPSGGESLRRLRQDRRAGPSERGGQPGGRGALGLPRDGHPGPRGAGPRADARTAAAGDGRSPHLPPRPPPRLHGHPAARPRPAGAAGTRGAGVCGRRRARGRQPRTGDVARGSARAGGRRDDDTPPEWRPAAAVRERDGSRRVDRDALHARAAHRAARRQRQPVPRHRLGVDHHEAGAGRRRREGRGARVRDEPRRAARRVPARLRHAAPCGRRMRGACRRRGGRHRLRRGSRACGVRNRPRPRRDGGASARGPRPRARRDLRARHRRPGHEGVVRAPRRARPDRRQRSVLVGLRDVPPDLRRGALAHGRAAGRRRVPSARPPRHGIAVHHLHELDGEAGAARGSDARGHRGRPRLLRRAQLSAEGAQAPGLRRARRHVRGAGRHVSQPGRAPRVRSPDGPACDLPGPGGPCRRVGRGAARPRCGRRVVCLAPAALLVRRARRAPPALRTVPRLREPLPRHAGRFRGRRTARRRQPLRADLPQRTRDRRPGRQPSGHGTRSAAPPPAPAAGGAPSPARRPAARPGDVREPPVLDLAARAARARGGLLGRLRPDDGGRGEPRLLLGQRVPSGPHRGRPSRAARQPGCRPGPVPDGGLRGGRRREREAVQLPDRDRLPGGGRQLRPGGGSRAPADRDAARLVRGREDAPAHGTPGDRGRRPRHGGLRRGVRGSVGGLPGVPAGAAGPRCAGRRTGARETQADRPARLPPLSPRSLPESRRPGDAGRPRLRRRVFAVDRQWRFERARRAPPRTVGLSEPGPARGRLGSRAAGRAARAAQLVRLRPGRDRRRRGRRASGGARREAHAAAHRRVVCARVDSPAAEDAGDEPRDIARPRRFEARLDAAVPGARSPPHDHHGSVRAAAVAGARARIRAGRVHVPGRSRHRPRVS